MPKPKHHILVCTNSRPPGHPKPSCGSAGAFDRIWREFGHQANDREFCGEAG